MIEGKGLESVQKRCPEGPPNSDVGILAYGREKKYLAHQLDLVIIQHIEKAFALNQRSHFQHLQFHGGSIENCYANILRKS